MPPSADTVHDRIIANVITTLAAIAVGSLYYTTVRRVYGMTGNPLQQPEMPCAIVQHVGTDESYGTIDLVQADLKLAVTVCMAKDESVAWQKLIRQFAEDVKRALRIDFNRGQFAGRDNAFDTYLDGVEVANENDGFPVALAQINVRIRYRHLLDDPAVAA